MVGLNEFERLQIIVVKKELNLDLEELGYSIIGLEGSEFDSYEGGRVLFYLVETNGAMIVQ